MRFIKPSEVLLNVYMYTCKIIIKIEIKVKFKFITLYLQAIINQSNLEFLEKYIYLLI